MADLQELYDSLLREYDLSKQTSKLSERILQSKIDVLTQSLEANRGQLVATKKAFKKSESDELLRSRVFEGKVNNIDVDR